MLVVITIIGVLAGLITAAGVAAIGQANRTTIRMDIGQLETALHAYEKKFGDFPPDFARIDRDSSKAIVLHHLRKVFPRYILSGSATDQWTQFEDDVNRYASAFNLTLDVNELSPAEAMVFWLGGLPDETGRLIGFSADPANPFGAGGSRLDPMFEFDETRLFDADVTNASNWLAYKSENVEGPVPYVYFCVRRHPRNGNLQYEFTPAGGGGSSLLSWNAGSSGTCVPYCVRGRGDWNKPKSFQIISPGMDGLFGNPRRPSDFRSSATGQLFTPGDYDNITNFSSNTLEDGLE